ncbi:hypothetical protein MVEN_00281800 [Mycena venus]|uniref:Uncharacterized protein n=1 Tax=Mycena venus TaxID=2733690 RepID=A0A8H7DCN4_9AGAR|nr:hypothetical protein MVEN_00281800 [Mycena venus]
MTRANFSHTTIMAFAFLPLPYLRSYSLPAQFIILIILCALSYRYPRFRLAVLGTLGVYTTYKVTPPLFRWAFAAFKTIVWFGFYVHFFILGVGYIVTGALGVWNLPETLQAGLSGMEAK